MSARVCDGCDKVLDDPASCERCFSDFCADCEMLFYCHRCNRNICRLCDMRLVAEGVTFCHRCVATGISNRAKTNGMERPVCPRRVRT